jgi:streptomycin 6-kinase
MSFAIPAKLSWLAGDPWLEALPRLVSDAVQRWDLTLGEPYPGSQVSYVVPAGPDVVLKVPWPHPESRFEAEALASWDGDGAVRLLAHDAGSAAMLLERCVPGTRRAGPVVRPG